MSAETEPRPRIGDANSFPDESHIHLAVGKDLFDGYLICPAKFSRACQGHPPSIFRQDLGTGLCHIRPRVPAKVAYVKQR